MLDTNISKYINSEGSVEEVGSGGGSIDADTLNGLLTGSNGISIAKNTAGDKVEVKIPDGITISNSLGSAQLRPQTISLFFNSESVGFMIDAVAGDIYKHAGTGQYDVYLRQGNVKTLFGNQSIYGSGNIDLYRHTIWFSYYTSEKQLFGAMVITSSSNTPIDSLTDLYTALDKIVPSSVPDNWYPINGRMIHPTYGAGILMNARSTTGGQTANIAALFFNDKEEHLISWADFSSVSITDTVTTV